MDLSGQRRSSNVEDRRGGGGRRFVLGTGGVIAVVVIGTLLGGDPQQILQALTAPAGSSAPAPSRTGAVPANDPGRDFVAGVLGSTEDTWAQLFAKRGATYEQPRLVLFRDVVESACGRASSATGPFYCPGDRKVYLDLAFFDELARRFKAPGDFAEAYVIAHEVGHHVQTLLGTERDVRGRQRGLDAAGKNALSVRMELQADCYAGVWAHVAQKERPFLQQGDVEEALGAATAIGDDRLQRQARGYVVPESFTHGSSAQRVQWFSAGFRQGTLDACDTFAAP